MGLLFKNNDFVCYDCFVFSSYYESDGLADAYLAGMLKLVS